MMNFNPPFYSYGFANGGPYCNNSNQQNINLSPTVIGEGEVNTVTLPDGTCQYFFTPKVKWWTLPTLNICPPHFNNTMNTNYSNPYDCNMGVWFIRSIVNPFPQFANNICDTPLRRPLRCERRSFCSDHDMNTVNPEYQLKFHHDGATSTTDIHYFYPCLRQYDCTFNFPPRNCAAVQIDTPAVTMCHKPENPNCCDCQCQKHSNIKSTKDDCNCHSSDDNKSTTDCCHEGPRQLIPTDSRRKRIKLEKKSSKKTKAKITCKCPPQSVNKSTVTYAECGSDVNPERDLDTRDEKKLKRNRDAQRAVSASSSKNFNCECIQLHSCKKHNICKTDKMKGQSCCGKRTTNILDANVLLCEDTD